MVSFNSLFIINNMYCYYFLFYMAYVQDFKIIFRIKNDIYSILF